MSTNAKPHWGQTVGAVICLVCMAVPAVMTVFRGKQSGEFVRRVEFRAPKSLPSAEGPEVAFDTDFYAGVDGFLSDHIGFRELLTRTRHVLDVRLLRRNKIGRVFVGNGEWLFNTLSTGALFGSTERVETAIAGVGGLMDGLQERDGRFILLIMPDKHTIYTDRIPPEMRIEIEESAEQRRLLHEFIASRDGVDAIDLWKVYREELAQNPDKILYWQRDSHYAHQGQATMIRELVTALYPDAWDDGSLRPHPKGPSGHQGDLGRNFMADNHVPEFPRLQVQRMGRVKTKHHDEAHEEFGGNPFQRLRWRVASTGLPVVPGRTLIFHDSFGWYVRWLLPWYFEEITMIDHKSVKVNPALIERALDDYDTVIFQSVERFAVHRIEWVAGVAEQSRILAGATD